MSEPIDLSQFLGGFLLEADENLRLGNLWYGVDLFALLLTTPWSGT